MGSTTARPDAAVLAAIAALGESVTINIAYLLERSGIKMGRIDERVTATLSDTQTASYLEVAVGFPLIRIVRTVFDWAGKLIEHVYGFYPAERYEYTVSVTRQARDS